MGQGLIEVCKSISVYFLRDAYGVIMHQAAPSSCLRTEKVDIRFVLFSKKNIFSRLIGHLGKIQIGKSKLVSLTSTQITLLRVPIRPYI